MRVTECHNQDFQIANFKSAQEFVKDAPHNGRPISDVTNSNADKAKSIIEKEAGTLLES